MQQQPNAIARGVASPDVSPQIAKSTGTNNDSSTSPMLSRFGHLGQPGHLHEPFHLTQNKPRTASLVDLVSLCQPCPKPTKKHTHPPARRQIGEMPGVEQRWGSGVQIHTDRVHRIHRGSPQLLARQKVVHGRRTFGVFGMFGAHVGRIQDDPSPKKNREVRFGVLALHLTRLIK